MMKKTYLQPAVFEFPEHLVEKLRNNYLKHPCDVELFEGRRVSVFGVTQPSVRKQVWQTILSYSKSSGILVSKIDDISVMRYQVSEGYEIHSDISLWDKGNAMRKISLIVQLSDEQEYSGGDVHLFDSDKHFSLPKKKGTGLMFPSFAQHQVTAVTGGTRLSLVCWAIGKCWQ